jgi:hypothetical protein
VADEEPRIIGPIYPPAFLLQKGQQMGEIAWRASRRPGGRRVHYDEGRDRWVEGKTGEAVAESVTGLTMTVHADLDNHLEIRTRPGQGPERDYTGEPHGRDLFFAPALDAYKTNRPFLLVWHKDLQVFWLVGWAWGYEIAAARLIKPKDSRKPPFHALRWQELRNPVDWMRR